MFDHSDNLSLSRQASAYAAFHSQPQLADAVQPTVVASNAPVAGLSNEPSTPHQAGIAPCYIQRGAIEDGGWSSVIATCYGRQASVGAQAQAMPAPSAFTGKDLLGAYSPAGQLPQRLIDSRAKLPEEPTLFVGATLMLSVLTVFLWQKIFGPSPIGGISH